jgi:chromatin segregation and condensation protein Rec8/ScpA/Scc1 (kleisin family)
MQRIACAQLSLATVTEQLIAVCSELTTRAFRASGRAFSQASRVADNLCRWVSG